MNNCLLAFILLQTRIGLGDLYGKTKFATDTRQVMHYYTGVKRTLGNGDKTGVWTLYK